MNDRFPQNQYASDPFFNKRSRERILLPLIGLLVGAFGFSFALTCLYHAMRGVMRLGGFVASGGPYVIAHEAPSWIWIAPVSIVTGMIFVFIHWIAARKLQCLSIHALAWPALFLSLGYNFWEFGFNPPGGGTSVAWLICGALFWLMGAVPVWIVGRAWLRTRSEKRLRPNTSDDPEKTNKMARTQWLNLTVVLTAVAGIYLAILFFRSLN